MTTTRFSTALLFAVLCGCGSSGLDVLSFDEFKAQAHQEPDTGLYIVNGDEVVADEDGLRQIYDAYLDTVSFAMLAEDGLAQTSQELAVNRVGGVDDKWSAARAANITFCVSQSSFGSRYNTVVNAMASATAAWEAAGRFNFVHSSAQDGNCTASNNNVVFDVRQTSNTSFLARAFFPSSGRASRNILISSSAFGSISPFTLTGILRHELGHTLGFRHEHTRPEAGTCFENNSFRVLTTYDAASVMHYPQCRGTNRGDLVLTARDQQGARALYP